MADITTAMIKELREKTGAGMMDAKKALVENNGDMEAAVDWMRKKGIAKAEKKASRVAAEGLVAVALEGTKGAVIEMNSETDFVARNEEFQNFVREVSQKALQVNDLDELKDTQFSTGKPVKDALTDLIGKIGENMTLRRMQSLSVSKGAVCGYVHSALAEGLGKIGVLVALESEAEPSKLKELGKKIAMHVAAGNPQALDRNSVDPEALERERSVLKEQAIASGKPADIAEKMVEGRLRKYYEEICLLDQVFVIDGESRVSDVVEAAAKEAGSPIKVTGFVRCQLGEGIEKEEEDFAAEVAKAANG